MVIAIMSPTLSIVVAAFVTVEKLIATTAFFEYARNKPVLLLQDIQDRESCLRGQARERTYRDSIRARATTKELIKVSGIVQGRGVQILGHVLFALLSKSWAANVSMYTSVSPGFLHPGNVLPTTWRSRVVSQIVKSGLSLRGMMSRGSARKNAKKSSCVTTTIPSGTTVSDVRCLFGIWVLFD
jgi:hypothetical protein